MAKLNDLKIAEDLHQKKDRELEQKKIMIKALITSKNQQIDDLKMKESDLMA